MTTPHQDPFGARAAFETGSGTAVMYRLDQLEREGVGAVSRLPYSLKVILEAILRRSGGPGASVEDVSDLVQWKASEPSSRELPFVPARVLLQDYTGLPAVADLAALRSAMHRLGGDPKRINPITQVDLVVDHSVQVDRFGSLPAYDFNTAREFERNRERYEFLRWGQKAFTNFRVIPPSTGIVHQVNLEYLASVVQTRKNGGDTVAVPDSLVGTDSHTTMINGLGVVGWGVGGIEAEAVMLGQPLYMLAPQVVGVKLSGELPEGATATDLVLTVTQLLRAKGVVDKFVEYCGPGISRLSLADRATIANMSPEYGATIGFFPVDDETLKFLKATGRSAAQVELVERYTKEQGLFRTDDSPQPAFSDMVELDLGTIEPSIAGPKRPQDRVPLGEARRTFRQALPAGYNTAVEVDAPGGLPELAGGRGGSAAGMAATPGQAPRPVRLLPRAGGGARRGDFDHPRVGRHRGDHELHQHLQPFRHDRRRPAGQEGCGARAAGAGVRQDQPGAGFAGRNGGTCRPPALRRICRPWDSTPSATAAPPASETAAPFWKASATPYRTTTW